MLSGMKIGRGPQGRKGKEEGKGAGRKEQRVKGGVEVRFFVCVLRCFRRVHNRTRYNYTRGRKEQWAEGDTYQKVASSERVCSCFLVCVRPRGEVLVRFW